MRYAIRPLVVAGLLLGLGRPAFPQKIELRSFGARGGVSFNPDQFHLGVFADAGEILDRVRFQPGFELGLGNGVRLAAANADALYLFQPRPWTPYAGAGLGINFIDVTRGVGEGRGFDLEPVLNLIGGVEWGGASQSASTRSGGRSGSRRRYLIEGRVGLGDTPDFKLTGGMSF
jgi:hypothetical protein